MDHSLSINTPEDVLSEISDNRRYPSRERTHTEKGEPYQFSVFTKNLDSCNSGFNMLATKLSAAISENDDNKIIYF